MSSLFGKKLQNQVPASSLAVQTSCQGLPIPIVWGRTRLAGNLIDYLGFSATLVSTGGGGGKGGLFKSSGKSQTYNYSVAVAIALCEGPVAAIGTVWNNNITCGLADLDLTLYDGDYAQGPWGYPASLGLPNALDYRGLGYVAGILSLGASPSLPNLGYEVTGAISGALAGLPDADPSAVIADLLGSANYGVGFFFIFLGYM